LSGFIFATTSAIVAARSGEDAHGDMHNAKNISHWNILRIKAISLSSTVK
jgi:hypothetical protein